MKRLQLVLSLFFALLSVYEAPAHIENKSKKLPAHYTAEDKVYAFSLVWSELKYNAVSIDRIGFDLDSLYRSYLPQVLKSRNDVEFFDLLKCFVARFDDGHTNVGGYPYNWSDVYDFAPMLFEEFDGHYYITRLWEASGLDSLALGASLIQIDDMPTQDYVEKYYLPYISHGSKRAKCSVAASDYIGTGMPGSRFRGVLKYRNGRERPFEIPNNYNELKSQHALGPMWHWPGFRKSRHAPVTLEWLKNDVAWMDFRFFHMKSIPLIDSMMQQVQQRAMGLIIDLRYCPGGSSPVGDSLTTRIINADYFLSGAAQTRVNNAYYRSQGNWRPEYKDFYLDRAYETFPADTIRIDRNKVFKKPIVILIDEFTASAAETFLIHIQELPDRPFIIGRQTEGSTGSPLVIDLPHDAWMRICTIRHIFPVSGKVFDREGITPDEIVGPTIDDHFTGRDRALERAVQIITEKK